MKTPAYLAFSALAIALTGAPATAATFSYEATDIVIEKEGAGKIDAVSTTFNNVTDLFTWSSTVSADPTTGAISEDAWLVINDGPAPKKSKKESVIFYLDEAAEKVLAYDYDSSKFGKSWKYTTLLGSEDLEVTTDGDQKTYAFDWDLTEINGKTDVFGDDWKGAAFDEEIGIWYHALGDSAIEYEGEAISDLSFTGRTAYDISDGGSVVLGDENSESVPEPGTALALGFTAAAAMFTKSRKQAA
ncbi:MAG: PEP-CTERM sorting domain-containing protein [Cyanobacteria bacterium P01_A01_bin.116]